MGKVPLGKYALPLVSALCLVGMAACSKSNGDGSDNSSVGGATGSSTPTIGSADYTQLASDARQVAAGKKLFSNCAVCHSADPATPSPAGPQLAAVVGRLIGGVEGYPYSQALKSAGGAWTPERLDAFLKNPMATYPGTAMAFGGLAKDADRKAIIAYLASTKAK